MLTVLLVYAVDDERISVAFPECEIRYVRTGIGKVKAAMRLLDAIHENRPDVVINIGTAGALSHRVGDIFVCRRFVDRDFQKVSLPGLDYELSLSGMPASKELFAGVDCSGICNTGDSFLTEVSEMKGDVFDMEAYAEALVCKEKNIPYFSVKYVTDVIGQNSVKHWEDKLADARMGLKDFLQKNL